MWRKLGDAPPDAAPVPMPQSSEPTSVRATAQPRYSTGSMGPNPNAPPRYGNAPGTPPRYNMGSTNSLDRVDKKAM